MVRERIPFKAAIVVVLGLLCAGFVAPASVIDAGRLGEVTVKLTASNPHDDDPGPHPVGAPVTLKRVGDLDLMAPEAWSAVADLTANDVLALPEDRFTDHRTTHADVTGTARFTGLPLGLWAAESTDGRFEPFILTLPRTSSDGGGWLYAVTAYAKPHVEGDGPTTVPVTQPAAPTEKPGVEESPTWEPPAEEPSIGGPDTGRPSAAPSGDRTSPDQQRQAGGPESLASTGAAVIGLIVAALVLIGAGLLLLRRGRGEPDDA